METVLRAVEQEPETSIRNISRKHQLSYSTVQRILIKQKNEKTKNQNKIIE